MMTSDKEISPPSLAFKMQIANFIVDKFPRQESRKELSGENNRKVTDVQGVPPDGRLRKLIANEAWW